MSLEGFCISIPIGVGGGILGDLSGFISSVFKSGINYINLPTTLIWTKTNYLLKLKYFHN